VAALDSRVIVEGPDNQSPLDFVLDCAGGENASTSVALSERLRRFGDIVFVGALTARAAFNTSLLMRNSNSVMGSFWFPHETAADVLALIASRAIDLSAFRAETFAIDQISAAMKHSVQHSGGLVHVALKP
jgi:threonine dehydrogenase-like Zn-dependent dehydrogenase